MSAGRSRLLAVLRLTAGTAVAVAIPVAVLVLAPAAPAAAHPMGNFSVNHHHGLRLFPDRVEDTAILDTAELPTLQERPAVDRDRDGTASPAERAAYGRAQCEALVASLRSDVNGTPLRWRIGSARYEYSAGAAGLQVARLQCELAAPAALAGRSRVRLADTFRTDRVGWREITAVGRGVRLDDPPVPSRSVTDALRRYPADPLASPLEVSRVELVTVPGDGSASGGPAARLPGPPEGFAAAVGRLSGRLDALVGADRLTLPIGLLAVAVAVALGVSHAALPGHGKALIAAYLAGSSGGWRDAVAVGATVTATHTSGVLVVGLALSLGASLAGESLLAWLGVASGLLIVLLGAGLLRSAWQLRRSAHAHHHSHDHSHDHGHGHAGEPGRPGHRWRWIVGMGVAGGLVPSPSALVVFLGAVGLGRTAFGVGLVVAYGLGMAAALTAAGLLLVSAPRRFAHTLSHRGHGGVARLAARTAAVAPMVTAGLVLVVGLGLVARSTVPLI
jgi:nickel/cobalt transporter (NicO) family protein